MVQKIPDHNVLTIVGAGPAGATLSLWLSKYKIPHVLLDKAVFPRDKICGDGLDLKVMRVLYNLNPEWLDEVLNDREHFHPCYKVKMISHKLRKDQFGIGIEESRQPFFTVARRAYFDNFLVSKLNPEYASIFFGTEVTSVQPQENGISVTAKHADGTEQTFTTDLLIGADGDHSTVLRGLGLRKIDRSHYAAALRCYYTGIEGINESGALEIYFPKSLVKGYFWIFPMANGEANIGLGGPSEVISRRKLNLRTIMDDLIKNDPFLAPKFKHAKPLDEIKGWGLPLASAGRPTSGDHFLLLGDAATLVNPLTGEGIGTAMFSASIAIHFIRKALKEKNFSAKNFEKYGAETKRQIQQEIKIYNFLNKPRFDFGMNMMIDALLRMQIGKRYFQKNTPGYFTTVSKPIDVSF